MQCCDPGRIIVTYYKPKVLRLWESGSGEERDAKRRSQTSDSQMNLDLKSFKMLLSQTVFLLSAIKCILRSSHLAHKSKNSQVIFLNVFFSKTQVAYCMCMCFWMLGLGSFPVLTFSLALDSAML